MKTLGNTAGRVSILLLSVFIIMAFCFQPMPANAEDSTGEEVILNAPASAGEADPNVRASGGSVRSADRSFADKMADADTVNTAVKVNETGQNRDVPVKIADFKYDHFNDGNIIFTFDPSSISDLSADYYSMSWERSGGSGSMDVYPTDDEVDLYCAYLATNEDMTSGGGKVTVKMTLQALDTDGNVIAESDPVSITLKISKVTIYSTDEITLPDRMLIGDVRSYGPDVSAYYQFKCSVNGSDASTDYKTVPIGSVTSVTTSSSKVIKKTKSEGAFYIKGLKVGKSTVTVKYKVNGKSKTVKKTIKVSDRYLQIDAVQDANIQYSDLPAGMSTSFILDANLNVYSSKKKEYLYKGIVTDYAKFKVTGILDYSTGDDVKKGTVTATIKDNILTIKSSTSTPDSAYLIKIRGTYGDAISDRYFYLYISPELDRLLVNDDFDLPLKGGKATFDPTLVHYSKGKSSKKTIKKLEIYCNDVTVKDKDGKTIKNGKSVSGSKLPLTVKATGENPYFRANAYNSKDKYVAYVSFDNYNKLLSYDISLSYETKAYTGKALKPKYTLKYNGKTVSKAGYKVKYYNNKDVGQATIRISDKSDDYYYRDLTFRITPKKTSISSLKGVSKGVSVKWKTKTGKMSTSRIDGYQIQVATNKYFTKNKKTKKVAGYKKSSYKVTGLKAKTTYYVRVRTYMKIGRTTYYSGWSKVGSVKTK
ncbi:MAG: fibronectin type III domain-containing protein [Firmicutes bacterium]|nr:fibronectin type III domain-containing protein [Bacillota bacterium]